MGGGTASGVDAEVVIDLSNPIRLWGGWKTDTTTLSDLFVEGEAMNPDGFSWVLRDRMWDESFNPFTASSAINGKASTDPSGRITKMEAIVDGVSVNTDVVAQMAAAKAEIDSGTYYEGLRIDDIHTDALIAAEAITSSVLLSGAVTAQTTELTSQHNRTMNRTLGGFPMINSVMGTGFVIQQGLQEKDLNNAVSKFSAELKTTIYDKVLSTYVASRTTLEQLRSNHMVTSDGKMAQSYQLNNTMKVDVDRMALEFEHREDIENTEYDFKAAMWDWEIIDFGTNLLNAQVGAVTQKSKGSFMDTLKPIAGIAASIGMAMATGGASVPASAGLLGG